MEGLIAFLHSAGLNRSKKLGRFFFYIVLKFKDGQQDTEKIRKIDQTLVFLSNYQRMFMCEGKLRIDFLPNLKSISITLPPNTF